MPPVPLPDPAATNLQPPDAAEVVFLGALVLRPLPAEVAERVESSARAMVVDGGMRRVARGTALEHLPPTRSSGAAPDRPGVARRVPVTRR